MMISFFLTSLMLIAQEPVQTPPAAVQALTPTLAPPLTMENRAVIRCSAAFALVGARQARDGGKSDWPELNARGREFFVVALAGVMDEHRLGREQITNLVRDEAVRLTESQQVDAVMPACLLMLETSGV